VVRKTSRRGAKKERKKNYASSRKLLTSIEEKGPLGKKSPFTRKKRSNTSTKGYKGYKKKAFSQEVRLLACSLKTISA